MQWNLTLKLERERNANHGNARVHMHAGIRLHVAVQCSACYVNHTLRIVLGKQRIGKNLRTTTYKFTDVLRSFHKFVTDSTVYII